MVGPRPDKLKPTDTRETPRPLSQGGSSAKKAGDRSLASWEQQTLELKKSGKLPDTELSRRIQHLIEQQLIRAGKLSSKDNPLGEEKDGEDREIAEQRGASTTPETRPGKRGDRVGKLKTSFYDHDVLYKQFIVHIRKEERKWYETRYNEIKDKYEKSLIQAEYIDRSLLKDRYKTKDGDDTRTIAKHRMNEAVDEFTQMLGDMLKDIVLYQRVTTKKETDLKTPQNQHRMELDPTNTESSSDSKLLSDAKAKGQDRIHQANLLRESDIEAYKMRIELDYHNRYETDIDTYDPDTDYDMSTHVKGNDEHHCYSNQLQYNSEKNIWTFHGMRNYKRRPPDNPNYSEEKYPLGCGKFDDEIEYKETQPLPNEHIIYNQVKDLNKRYNRNIIPDIYHEHFIINAKDRKIIDAFIPNTGEMTFSEDDAEYFIILGTDTGKAKPNLAVLFGKSISSITIEKKPNPGSSNERLYSIEYRYSDIQTMSPTDTD